MVGVAYGALYSTEDGEPMGRGGLTAAAGGKMMWRLCFFKVRGSDGGSASRHRRGTGGRCPTAVAWRPKEGDGGGLGHMG
jgi:hypothetical protein